MASGGLHWTWRHGLLLLAAVILTDGLWGQLWELLAAAPGQTASGGESRAWRRSHLPYAAPDAAAERLGRWFSGPDDAPGAADRAYGGRGLLMAGAFSCGLAAFLGAGALWLTVGAAVLAILARSVGGRHGVRPLLQAVFEIGLPWLLGLVLFKASGWTAPSLAIGLAYVLLLAGSTRPAAAVGALMMNLGLLTPLACLVGLRQPVAIGCYGIALLPPLAWQPWLTAAVRPQWDPWRYRQKAQVWWWLGMIIAAWAVGWAGGRAG